MKKVCFVFLTIGLLIYFAGSSYAQHGSGAGRTPSIGQTHGPDRVPGSGRTDSEDHGGGNPASGQPAAQHPDTKVSGAIERNPQLSSRLQALLPPGMTLANAAAGFKNQGQFIAALHVSQNLGIPFADLKAKMTGSDHVSLGKAIQALRPDLSPDQAKTAAKTAETEAKTR